MTALRGGGIAAREQGRTRGAGASLNHWSMVHDAWYDIVSVPATGGAVRVLARAGSHRPQR